MLFHCRLNTFILFAFLYNVSTLQAQQALDSESRASFTPPTPELTQQSKEMMQRVNARINNINTEELRSILESKPETVLIDVRTPAELNLMGGHIDSPRHQNILRGWLEFQIETRVPNKDTPIVTYCGVNLRSPLAADALMKLGYSNVKNYEDGFFSWRNSGLPIEQIDKVHDNFLYSLPVEVIPGVWSAIGATAPGTYENTGHNNNLSFVITDDGVLVMNAGDNYLLAKSLHDQIKLRTDQKVKYVVLENAQGHAANGTSYWLEQGATVIVHEDAYQELNHYGEESFERMRNRLRDKAYKTEFPKPNKIIGDRLDITMGSWNFQILNLGLAHSPGDIVLWIPEKSLVISGDLAFHERLLPIFEHTDTAAWVETWDTFEELGAEFVIPGHGGPTDIATTRKWTLDYLTHLRAEIGKVLDDGGDLLQAYGVDQSAYSHLDTFDELALRNAGTVFRAMEFE